MKIITSNPVFSNCQGETKLTPIATYSSVDGSSSASDIKEFQSWYNARIAAFKYPSGVTPEIPLVVDGKWGAKTAAAWGALGSVFNTSASIPTNALKSALSKSNNAVKESKILKTDAAPVSTTAAVKEKVSGLKDKWNALTPAKKIAVVAVPVILIAVTIYFIKKRKK